MNAKWSNSPLPILRPARPKAKSKPKSKAEPKVNAKGRAKEAPKPPNPRKAQARSAGPRATKEMLRPARDDNHPQRIMKMVMAKYSEQELAKLKANLQAEGCMPLSSGCSGSNIAGVYARGVSQIVVGEDVIKEEAHAEAVA